MLSIIPPIVAHKDYLRDYQRIVKSFRCKNSAKTIAICKHQCAKLATPAQPHYTQMIANQSAQLAKITIGGKDFSPCFMSFQGSDSHLDQSGLISFTGEVILQEAIGFFGELDDRANIKDFCRGNKVLIDVGGKRHPRGALRVMSSAYDLDRRELSIQVGDLIALLNGREPTDPDTAEIVAGEDKSLSEIISNLLKKAGISRVSGNLPDNSINYPINLSGSYLQSVGKILYCHGCFGWVDKDENFRIEKINFNPSNGVSIQIGKDEVWYRRLSGSEQPCSIIKAVATGKILRPYPKERKDYSETYGAASTVDAALDDYRIIVETVDRTERWEEEQKLLTIKTLTKKPIGLVIPNDVLEAVFSNISNKTALIEYQYREEYFYYEKDSECKVKRKQERIYGNIGNLYREVILGSSSPSGYAQIVFELGPEQEIFTDYQYSSRGVITSLTTTTNEHILSVLNDSGEDWEEWGNLDFFTTSAIKTEEWQQIKKGTPGTWSYKVASQQALVRVRADSAEGGPSGNKTALVDDGTGKYQVSNSGQLTPPAPERCPVSFTIDEVSIEGRAEFNDPCDNDLKSRERTYSVDLYSKARIDAGDGNTFFVGEEPGRAILKGIASREGKLLFGRYKGQDIATPLYSGWFGYKPLMGISAAEPKGGVQSFLVDGASWVIGVTKALVSCDGIWLGNSSGGSVSAKPAIITTSTGETLSFPGGTAYSEPGTVTVTTSTGEILTFPGGGIDSIGGETEITGGDITFPYQEVREFSLGIGMGMKCKGYPYLLTTIEKITFLGLGLGISCNGGFALPLGLGLSIQSNGSIVSGDVTWDNVNWDNADWDSL